MDRQSEDEITEREKGRNDEQKEFTERKKTGVKSKEEAKQDRDGEKESA